MLVSTISTKVWEDQFTSKFANFCKKAPILLKMSIRLYEGEKGVLITHVNSGLQYFYPFNYDIDVKDFIANIKKDLAEKHYPRVIETVLERYEKTPEDLAIEIEKGNSADSLKKYEMRTAGTRQFRIDKVLSWKEIVILELERSTFSDDKVGQFYRYKFEGSLVIFLKNYRNGKYKSIEEASDYFFSNSLLIDEISKAGEKPVEE